MNRILILCALLIIACISVSSCSKKDRDITSGNNNQIRKSITGEWYLKSYYSVSYDTAGNVDSSMIFTYDFLFRDEYTIFNNDGTWREQSSDPLNALYGTYSVGDKITEYNFYGNMLIKVSQQYTDSSVILEVSDNIIKIGQNNMRTPWWASKPERDEVILTYERVP